MGMKKLPKNAIEAEAKGIDKLNASTDLEKRIFDYPSYKKDGSRESPLDKNPYVVLKYFQSAWECFSDWEKAELQLFSNFLTTLSGHTWSSVYKTAGKGEKKTGLGYTPYAVNDMKAGGEPVKKVIQALSPEITLFELRVSQKIRVHGFQSQSAFFIILLDRQHRVFPD